MDGFIARTRDRKQVEKAWTMKTDNLSDNRPKAIEIRRKRGNRKRKRGDPDPATGTSRGTREKQPRSTNQWKKDLRE